MAGFMLIALLFIAGLVLTLFTASPTKKFVNLRGPSSVDLQSNPPMEADHDQSKAKKKKKNEEELKGVFSTFDKDSDGFITKEELIVSLESVGFVMTEKEVAEVMEQVDSNGDGLIDFDEFCGILESVTVRDPDQDQEEMETMVSDDLKDAFGVFDENGDGLITVEELSLVLSSLGMKEGMMLEKCKEMIEKVDMDGDGKVNFDEFRKMMKIGTERLIKVS